MPAAIPTLGFNLSSPLLQATNLDGYLRIHQAHVKSLNAFTGSRFDGETIEDVAMATRDPHFSVSEIDIFNHAVLHFSHAFFWRCLFPGGSKVPSCLNEALTTRFGSVEGFKKDFCGAVMASRGAGWTWLVYEPMTRELITINYGHIDIPTTTGRFRPLLAFDASFMPHIRPANKGADADDDHAEDLQEFWKIVNWQWVDEQFRRASAHQRVQVTGLMTQTQGIARAMA
jgi:Fe-Mn family superoxide dismutase